MPVKYWDDGGEGHSWQTVGNWSGDAKPIAADEVIFDGRASTGPDSGVAVGETGGIDFDLIHVKKTFAGDIGDADNRLHTSAQKIIIEGSGTYYIEVSGTATGQDKSIPLVIINNKSATVYLTSNENTASWCCDFVEVIVLAGTVYIGDSNIDTAVETLRLSPKNNKASNVTVYIYEDCECYKTAATYKMSIYMSNGICTLDSAATLIDMKDGTFNYGTAGAEETGMDVTMLRLYGGTFNWYPDDTDDDAKIDEGWLFGGTFSASATTNNDRTKYLGGGAGEDFYVFEGATLNVANNMGNILITASSYVYNFGGTIVTDAGVSAAFAYDIP